MSHQSLLPLSQAGLLRLHERSLSTITPPRMCRQVLKSTIFLPIFRRLMMRPSCCIGALAVYRQYTSLFTDLLRWRPRCSPVAPYLSRDEGCKARCEAGSSSVDLSVGSSRSDRHHSPRCTPLLSQQQCGQSGQRGLA